MFIMAARKSSIVAPPTDKMILQAVNSRGNENENVQVLHKDISPIIRRENRDQCDPYRLGQSSFTGARDPILLRQQSKKTGYKYRVYGHDHRKRHRGRWQSYTGKRQPIAE